MSVELFRDLRAFLRCLKREGDLAVVQVPVSADQEVAEIHRRVIAAGGPALLFDRIQGADHRLVTNLFGTARRVELAFGPRPTLIVQSLVRLVRSALPPTAATFWQASDLLRVVPHLGTRRAWRAPVLEVVTSEVRLDRLPALTSWPEDGGPFVTLPLVYTEHPEHGEHNLGMYRLQIHDHTMTGMHWQIGKGGGFHYAEAERRGLDLPVSVFLGGPPALTLAAIAPLPEKVPELVLASLVAGRRLRWCSGPGQHRLLADAEMALVGRVPAGERLPEGPFGDHYGYYSLQHDYPVFRVEAICRRRDAIFPATVVGKPRQEDFFIGDYLQELLTPLAKLAMPGVEDLWSYGETGYHCLAAARLRERYRREAMTAAFRILGEGQLSLTKVLLVTDGAVDLKDFVATLEYILERTDPAADLLVLSKVAMDTLDYTGPEVNLGSKAVWLGIGEPKRQLPRQFEAAELPVGAFDPRVFCGGCLVIGGPSWVDEPGAAERFARHESFAAWPLVVVTDEPLRAAASPINFLWTTFTRFEPAADLHAAALSVKRYHLELSMPLVIDARMKPGYPAEVACDPQIAERVTRRWREYFPAGNVEMGDSDRAHLD